jgi:hypothetical protein
LAINQAASIGSLPCAESTTAKTVTETKRDYKLIDKYCKSAFFFNRAALALMVVLVLATW